MASNRSLHLILCLMFVASGCAALIYEVVWFQQLGLSLGASAISLAIVLTSFMGGMCLGSLLLPRLVSRKSHPLAVYARLEFLLGICGAVILWSLPAIGSLYWSLGFSGTVDIALRAGVALLVLLPPTMLMGATLPAMSRAFEASAVGMSWLGRFYSANTLGAVLGCLASGLYLLRLYDVSVATTVAVSLNFGVALVAFCVQGWLPYEAAATPVETTSHRLDARGRVVAIAIGLSGLTALGSEVVWTRLLALLFGPTTYTFSLILAVFLFGLAVGSRVGAELARRMSSPALALAVNQVLLALAIPFAGFMIINVLPFWMSGDRDTISLTRKMYEDIGRAAAAILPATLLWGASFPLAIAAATRDKRDNASLVGQMYAANTLGAVLGAIGVSLVAVPQLGSRFAMQTVTFLAGCSGLFLLAVVAYETWMAVPSTASPRPAGQKQLAFAALLSLIVCPFATSLVPKIPDGLLAWGRVVSEWPVRKYVYVAEGMDSAIVISDREDGMRAFHVAGKVEASTLVSDMRTQRLLGHLPAMVHGNPKRILVICCGSGMTAGAALLHPGVEKLTLCEIEHQVTVAARKFFSVPNHGALDDPRLEIVIDDGRHFLATTKEKFDIISTDPIHPWVRGAASLYTEEFYRLCKEHLNPGGVVTQWVPLYESSEAAVKSELATLMKVFPHAALYSGQGQDVGYDVVAIGMLDESRLDPAHLTRAMLTTPEIRDSLGEVGYDYPNAMQDLFVAYGSELQDWLKDAQVNRDSNLRLQYLAGMTQAPESEQKILTAIRACRRTIWDQSPRLAPSGLHDDPSESAN